MPFSFRSISQAAIIAVAFSVAAVADDPTGDRTSGLPGFEIQIVDDLTGRGVPMVELETVHHQRFITDNAGHVAFLEPDLLGREVFFSVKSHGYELKKDGFGYRGVRLQTKTGGRTRVEIHRINIAERLCRLTGAGRFRDSVLLGHDVSEGDREIRGGVVGQDSIQAAVYRGKNWWFWGDTSRASYPLGLFRTAGATSPLFNPEADHLDRGIPYEYFTDKNGFARAMMPYAEHPEGVIWISGVCVVPDRSGRERMIAHFSRRKGLAEQLEHGLAVFNDDTNTFEHATTLPPDETWRFPDSHPVIVEYDGRKWLSWGDGGFNVRVSPTYEDVLDPANYEAFTCADGDSKDSKPVRDVEGAPVWSWSKSLRPVNATRESEWVKSGAMKPEECRYFAADVAHPDRRSILQNGTVRWNKHRHRWVLIGLESYGEPSFLGEVWYAEANSPTGPFNQAVRIVTHDKQSFYNVCHHEVLDQEGGRFIHFEGTYTNTFSNDAPPTPLYDYNQILYRLDLDSPELIPAFVPDAK
jgi:hypothetical protein